MGVIPPDYEAVNLLLHYLVPILGPCIDGYLR
jgi:hypothetical protein